MTTSETPSEPVQPVKRERSEAQKATKNNLIPGGKPLGNGKIPRLLSDMRRVYECSDAKNFTAGQKVCKQLLEENPKEFIARLSALEQAHQATVVRAAASGVESALEEKRDEGVERCEELIGRMLDEAAGQGH